MDQITLNDILFNPVAGKIAFSILGISLIWIIIKTIQRRLILKIKENDNRYRAKKFSGFVGYFLSILLITLVYSNKLGGLTVAFGVAGAGIAFALQEVIASFAGWLAIVFGKFYKTGDRVELGGIKGDVMDIGALRTTIMETGQWIHGDQYNGRIVFVANSFVFKEPVYNYSGEFPFLWDELLIPIQFGSDYKGVEKLLLEIAKEVIGTLPEDSKKKWQTLQNTYKLENVQYDPMVSVNINDSFVEYTLRYVVDYKKRRSTKTILNFKILEAIEANKNTIDFPTNSLNIVGFPK
ncbi:transporter [Wenyingzhuangia fucanilytica]|uniref:Transporter n=1 Tax=Wenyingzhuangia fucanilytica TaxID=1790137 RepID=A0A1B1Y5W1_9FLAO|nr:mechanosensitive ion channel domain-containing protein [Wenyingzhuangia fucanilytica]ANW96155.1 transporter [Wenyingzhuangia fucanilytica]